MHKKQRHFLILKDLREKIVATVPDLVQITGASVATIRRDIIDLDEAGKLKKIRGGAEALSPVVKTILDGVPFDQNQEMNAGRKTAIAQCAAALCKDGDSIILSGGTTLFFMAKALNGRNVTVLTNSLPNMEYLLAHTAGTVMMPGGVVYREQNIMLSPFEDRITKSFFAKHCFFSALSAGPAGPMEADELIIKSVVRFLSQARSLVLLLDSSKFNSKGSMIVCPWEKIDTVISDSRLPKEKQQWIQDLGIQLVIAPDHEQDIA